MFEAVSPGKYKLSAVSDARGSPLLWMGWKGTGSTGLPCPARRVRQDLRFALLARNSVFDARNAFARSTPDLDRRLDSHLLTRLAALRE